MKNRVSPQDLELLSAYLDGELSPRQKENLEQQLKTNTTLRQLLADLRLTRKILRSTPVRRLPRSFTLTEEMLRPKPLPFLFPVFSAASAISLILIFLSFFIRIAPSPAMAPAQRMLEQAAPMIAPLETATAAPLIYWGGLPTMPVEGLGGGGPPAPATMSDQREAEELTTKQIPGEAPDAPALPAETPIDVYAEPEAFLPPPEIAQPTAAPQPSATPLALQAAELPPPGGVPILGIPPTQEMGRMQYTPIATLTEEPPLRRNNILMIRLLLLSLALISGAGAITLYRKYRA
ncbi:MAG: hypothetical protein HPY45_00820 [Anaerolineae bacterium]|nr:hypothetical protein [Anaerolineae bacterium]